MAQWWVSGARPDTFPAIQRTDDWARLIVFADGHPPLVYEVAPRPTVHYGPFGAWGSGRDFAIGAMAAGADAAAAVRAAIQFDTNCGGEIDVRPSGCVIAKLARPDELAGRFMMTAGTVPFV
jgi:hypothetical protein